MKAMFWSDWLVFLFPWPSDYLKSSERIYIKLSPDAGPELWLLISEEIYSLWLTDCLVIYNIEYNHI